MANETKLTEISHCASLARINCQYHDIEGTTRKFFGAMLTAHNQAIKQKDFS